MESDSSVLDLVSNNDDILIEKLETKIKKMKVFHYLYRNKKNNTSSEYFDETLLFLVGLMSSQIFGNILGFGSVVFGMCHIKHKIPKFENVVMLFFLTSFLLELSGWNSQRVVPFCDMAFIFHNYISSGLIKNKETIFLTISIISFLNPFIIYNLFICCKYIINIENYVNMAIIEAENRWRKILD